MLKIYSEKSLKEDTAFIVDAGELGRITKDKNGHIFDLSLNAPKFIKIKNIKRGET